jgi:thiamine pyrophosphate-dependent acetolactate synthase large subunit-like protein
MAMKHRDALEVLVAHRERRIVLSTMGSVAIWHELSDTPLDFPYIPSAMGQGAAVGLGLALARPERGVIALCGDGSMLMNLGVLVTIANHPANLFLIIIDNGLYEVTGGQPTAGAGHTDWPGLARAAGIGRVYSFDQLDKWRRDAPQALAGKGPAVIHLKIEGLIGQKTPAPPRPMAEQIQRLKQALAQ